MSETQQNLFSSSAHHFPQLSTIFPQYFSINPEMYSDFDNAVAFGRGMKNQPNQHAILLPKFDPKTIELNCDENARITITAKKVETMATGTNSDRKITTLLEETVQLPIYLKEQDLLNEIESSYENNYLVIKYPQKKVSSENENDTKKVKIPINIEKC